jgi:hypothetical protein
MFSGSSVLAVSCTRFVAPTQQVHHFPYATVAGYSIGFSHSLIQHFDSIAQGPITSASGHVRVQSKYLPIPRLATQPSAVGAFLGMSSLLCTSRFALHRQSR